MGFFSPGFIIGAASSLSNQIETAQERNAAEMERRRNQFDILSRETQRELRKKRQSQEEQAAALETLIGQYPEGRAILSAIGDDTTSRAGLYKDFALRKEIDRNFSPKNFALSVYRNGMKEDGSFDPGKVVSVTKPEPMDDLEKTGESFIETFGRKLTGAPSARELQETDVSRLSSDIPEATVKMEKVYNPVPVDSREWANYEKLFAEIEKVKVVVDPFDKTLDRVKTFADTEDSTLRKFQILNGLRIGQAYTEDDLPSILTDVNTIYSAMGGHESLSTEQADAVISKIASDMNRTSVSEVMKNLEQYVPAKKDKDEASKDLGTAKKLTESGIDPGLRQAITEQIGSGNATNIQTDESKPPVYEVEYNGKTFLIQNDSGKLSIVG